MIDLISPTGKYPIWLGILNLISNDVSPGPAALAYRPIGIERKCSVICEKGGRREMGMHNKGELRRNAKSLPSKQVHARCRRMLFALSTSICQVRLEVQETRRPTTQCYVWLRSTLPGLRGRGYVCVSDRQPHSRLTREVRVISLLVTH